MPRHALPVFPFVQARHLGGPQDPTAVVLKLSSTTSDKGAALGVAQYHHKSPAPVMSFHYVVDNEMVYQCAPLDVAVYGNFHRAISILICAEPHEVEAMWEDATAKPVLTRTASLVADVMLSYKIPCRYLENGLEQKWLKHKWRGRGGLIVRIPGTFPRESFLRDVLSQMNEKKAQRRKTR